MKKQIYLLILCVIVCVGMLVSFTGCASKNYVGEQLDPINEKTDSILDKINTISDKIAAINASVDALKVTDTSLETYIKALEDEVAELEASDTATATQIAALNAAIAELKSKCEELEANIEDAISDAEANTAAIEEVVDTFTGYIADLEDVIADLQAQINCLNGKHVVGETYTSINDIMHSYECAECGVTVVERHTFDESLCVCGYDLADVTLPEVSDPIEIPAYDVTNPETVGSDEVSVTIPADVVNSLPTGVTGVSIAYAAPVFDDTNKTITFDAVELVDQNGNIIDLSDNTAGNLTVTLPVDGIADGVSVSIYHDGELMGYAEVVNGTITYEVAHLCAIEIREVIYVSTFADLQTAVTAGKSVVLAADIQATNNSALIVPQGVDATLDLNGFTYTSKDGGGTNTMAIRIEDGATFVLNDSVGTGKVVASCYGVYVKVASTFVMNGGTLEVSGNGVYDLGVTVWNGTFVMNAGTIRSNIGIWTDNYYRNNGYTGAPNCSITINDGCIFESIGYADIDTYDALDSVIDAPDSLVIYKG